MLDIENTELLDERLLFLYNWLCNNFDDVHVDKIAYTDDDIRMSISFKDPCGALDQKLYPSNIKSKG